ncbi:AMP-binding protein [Burkholderiaceae bacterium UC74_6]
MLTQQESVTTLAALLERQAVRLRDAPALLAPGRAGLGYAGLWEQVREIAATLHGLGLTSQDRVAVVLPNGPEMASAFLGVAAYAACAPLNPAYTAEEFRFYLNDLGAKAVLLRPSDAGAALAAATELGLRVLEVAEDASQPAGRFSLRPQAAAGAPVFAQSQDVALVLHTSGTTARPKIVPLTQANLLASASNVAQHLALTPADSCLNVMPLFHIHGLVAALLASLRAGSSMVCTPGFQPAAFFDWVAAFSPSWYTAVPTMHQALLAQGTRYRQLAPAHRFRCVRSSSAALPPSAFAALQSLFDAPVIEAYGMTEATHQMACNPLAPGRQKPGSVGLPTGVDIALMDEAGQLLAHDAGPAEIVIRGPSVTAGYAANPEANAKAYCGGWFRTGDQGRFDADGYLYITGRIKEIVNRGGEKVSPREVDEALLAHPQVLEATAFSVPHPSLGEDLAAVVVLRSGVQVDEAQLRHHLFARLADFKVPSRIVLATTIPKGPTGKVQRLSLHAQLKDQLVTTFAAPCSATEQQLAGIFQQVLGCAAVGVNDNFFALGGDSLRGTLAMTRINAQFGTSLAVPVLFRLPTVAALAAEVDAAVAALSQALAEEIAQLSDEEVALLLAQAQQAGEPRA